MSSPSPLDGQSLQAACAAHQEWLESGGQRGQRALFDGYDLTGGGLLRGVCLRGAGLGRANFKGGDLRGTDFRDADLTGADFRNADLRDADLSGARGVAAEQFAGANVAGAKLPEAVAKFEGLARVEKAAEFAQRLFVLLLLQSLYALLTIVSTSDVQLLTNSSSLVLPGVSTPIPTVPFYLIGPVVLLAFYAYFHLYLHSIWEDLARLPEVFVDGRRREEVVYPWLLTRAVRDGCGRWAAQRSPLGRLGAWVAVGAAWGLVPALVLAFWWGYLPRHDWRGTTLHVGLLGVAAWAGLWLYAAAITTLGHKEEPHRLLPRPPGLERFYEAAWRFVGAGVVVVLVASWLALGRFPFATDGIVPWSKADFSNEVVATLPAGWAGKDEQVELVKGVSLRERDLRYLQGSGVVLVRADLHGANARNADLYGADLRMAKLTLADLTATTLSGAQLQRADLTGAVLEGAQMLEANFDDAVLAKAQLARGVLTDARLRRAKLHDANLTEANLRRAHLDRAELQGADLHRADLQNAVLTGAILARGKLIGVQFQNAKLDKANLDLANLAEAVLEKADLTGTSLEGADLSKTNLKGTDLRQVQGLTQEQLDSAIRDQTTLLPAGLR